MEEVLVFQHDPFEDLGFFAEVLEKQGSDYRVVRLFHGEMPAEEWEHVSALIVLGGPMNVDEEEGFPFLRWEKRIIRAAIDEAVPILGICLGAQLIASDAWHARSFTARSKKSAGARFRSRRMARWILCSVICRRARRCSNGTAMVSNCPPARFGWRLRPITVPRLFASAKRFTAYSFISK